MLKELTVLYSPLIDMFRLQRSSYYIAVKYKCATSKYKLFVPCQYNTYNTVFCLVGHCGCARQHLYALIRVHIGIKLFCLTLSSYRESSMDSPLCMY